MRLKAFLRAGHPKTLAMAFLYFDVSFMVWVLIGVLAVYISADFGLSPSQKGLLAALPILGGSLVRVPMGILVDRMGPKRTGVLGQLLVMLPLLWAWQGGRSLPEVMALALLLGVAGGSFAVALPLASRWYPPAHQGLVMGIAGAGNSGTVLAALFAPRLAETVGWHNVFGLALIPVGLALVLFVIFARESPAQPAPKPFREYFRIFRERDALWLCLFYGFTFGGFVGLASFLVVFFHDQYGIARVTAGNLTALCVLAGCFLRPVGGYLSDKFGGIRLLSVLFSCAAIFTACVGLLPPAGVAAVLLALTMATLGLGNGSVFQLVPQRFRKEIGVATGVVGAAGGLGGFLLPSLLGAVREASGSYAGAFFILSATGLGGLALLRALRARWVPLPEKALGLAPPRGGTP